MDLPVKWPHLHHFKILNNSILEPVQNENLPVLIGPNEVQMIGVCKIFRSGDGKVNEMALHLKILNNSVPDLVQKEISGNLPILTNYQPFMNAKFSGQGLERTVKCILVLLLRLTLNILSA